MANAEFSKFASILSAALSQHHLLGFEIAQLEFHTEELYKKDLHDPDNQDGVITHLEPDILECEVKWALGSITMTKLVEVMEFQVSYFIFLKDDAVKVLHSTCQHIWKTQQWAQDWKRSVFIAMPKIAQITAELRSSHTLVK